MARSRKRGPVAPKRGRTKKRGAGPLIDVRHMTECCERIDQDLRMRSRATPS
jgi:hypothetical protein